MAFQFFRKTMLASLFGSGLFVSNVQAQNPTYTVGDLILYFQKDGGTETVYVGLGSAALLYRGNAAGPTADREKLNIININTELTTAFGADWASQTNVYAGLAAARSSSTGTGIFDGDQTRTLYVSRGRTAVGTLGQVNSAPWDLTSGQPYTGSAGSIIAMGNTFELNYTTAAAVSPTSVSTIDTANPFLAPGIQGTAFGGFAGGVQQVGTASAFGTFGPAGQVEFALDLNRIVPRLDSETAGVEVTGTQHIGTYEGTIVVGTDGNVSFITTAPTAAEPEIVLEQPLGSSLTNSTSIVDFGNQNTGTTSATKTFFIRNTGNAPLSGITVTGGTAEFIVTAQPATSVTGGNDTSFTVTFQPSAAGARSATLLIASNDGDENPFTIPLTGTGVTPPPPPAFPEIAVEQPQDVAINGNGASRDFGSSNVGSAGTSLTFAIRNTGDATLSGIAVSGATAEFILAAQPAASLAADAVTFFTVTFQPSAAGARSATLQISSNDADENPFSIVLGGTGITPPPPAVPEIVVVVQPENTQVIDNGPAVDFGSSFAGSTGSEKSFIIRNSGNAPLTGIAVTGATEEFVVTTQPAASLAVGLETSFTVTFQPSVVGARSATFQIASNDADENPFDVSLSGTGVTPPESEISVSNSSSGNLIDGDRIRLGNIAIGSASEAKVFTIKNNGDGNLTGLKITKKGKQTGDFLISGPRKTSLAPGESIEFSVTFKPTRPDHRTTEIRIESNDADESPFNITVSGCGIPPAPEIVVEQPAKSTLADGRSQKSFGTVKVGATGRAKTFTIKNTGSAKLTGIVVSIDGQQAGDFSVTKPKLATLAPGGSTTFRVSFKPTAVGPRFAALKIKNNDTDESPFDIRLSGQGAK